MRFNPHQYQQHCIDELIHRPQMGLFLDMGLGKTVITLSALNDLRYDYFRIFKTLIIAPKKVAEATWQAEQLKWDHLKHLKISTVLGTPKERIRALQADADIYIINRENVCWLVDILGDNWFFDTVVIDELSSFKNASSKRFRALRKVRGKIHRIYGLTGTPAPNGYIDLWAQIYLLDRGERLYNTKYKFIDRYVVRNPYTHEMRLKKGADKAIEAKLKDLCISLKASDYLNLPAEIINDIPVHLDAKAMKQYTQLERDYILGALEDEDLITATSAGVLTNKLLQLSSGAVYDDNKGVHLIHDHKIEALKELVESINAPTIIFYQYQHEKERIIEALKGYTLKTLDSAKEVEEWNNKELDILLCHPASTAYGLNLQDGGNNIIWFTLTWSLELYLQANKRLHRQGQTKPVIVHRLISQGTKDEQVAKALAGKDRLQEILIEALKARLKEYRGNEHTAKAKRI